MQQNTNLPLGAFVALAFALGLVCFFVVGAILIGGDRLAGMGQILVIGVVACGIILSLAVLVRMYRKSDANPVVERHFTDGTTKIVKEQIIDGRPQIAGALGDGDGRAFAWEQFPDLVRASIEAGRAGQLPGRSTFTSTYNWRGDGDAPQTPLE